MDIFEWAEDHDWSADYMDQYTGTIYACTEYKNNAILPGIPMYRDNKLVGFAKRKEN